MTAKIASVKHQKYPVMNGPLSHPARALSSQPISTTWREPLFAMLWRAPGAWKKLISTLAIVSRAAKEETTSMLSFVKYFEVEGGADA